jgi:hypothetical protein
MAEAPVAVVVVAVAQLTSVSVAPLLWLIVRQLQPVVAVQQQMRIWQVGREVQLLVRAAQPSVE